LFRRACGFIAPRPGLWSNIYPNLQEHPSIVDAKRLNGKNALLAVFVALTVAFGSVAVSGSFSRTTITSTTTVFQTATVTRAPSFNYPVTFLVTPTQCFIQALCVNATLVDHMGQNLSVILAAWIRNATTGQNVTILGGGKDSVGYASCSASTVAPQKCYLSAIPSVQLGTFEVTVFVLSWDGKIVISPSAIISANLH